MERLKNGLVILTLSLGLAILVITPGLAQEQGKSEMISLSQEEWSKINQGIRRLTGVVLEIDMWVPARRGDISSFIETAENGDVTAQINLALRYERGVSDIMNAAGVLDLNTFNTPQEDYCLMRYWLTRAAQSDDLSALALAAWFYGLGVFDKPDPKLAYFYLSKWGEQRGIPEVTWRGTSILLLDDEKFDDSWPEEYHSWSSADVPLPPRASCVGCPPGQADQCLADQNSD